MPEIIRDSTADARLERRLGVTGLAVHFVCSVLGAGILILPGIALVLAGPASVLAWVFLVGFSFLFAWVLARLSVEHPDCHGLPLFVRSAFGPDWERGLAALLALAMAGGVIPVYGIAAARRLAALGLVPADWPPAAVGGAVILAAIAVNLAGLRLGLRLLTAMVGVVVAVLVCAIALAAPHARPVDVLAVPPDGWSAVGLAVAVCFFAVIGWENAAPLAEEVADPARTVPRAAMIAATLVGLLYLGFATMLAMTVGDGQGDAGSPVAALLSTALGAPGDVAGDALALGLIVLAANAWVLATSRTLYGMARSRMLPPWFNRLSRDGAAPVRCNALIAIAAAAVLGAAVHFDFAEPQIMAAASAAFLVIYAVVVAGAARRLRRRAERRAALAALAVLVLMAAFHAAASLAVLLALGLVVTASRALRRSRRPVEGLAMIRENQISGLSL